MATVSSLIASSAAPAISARESSARCTCSTMFDCPEQSHTSPTSTSRSCCAAPLRVRTVRSNGPPAGSAGSSTCQAPSAPARASTSRPANVARTISFGGARPQRAIGRSRCNTAWSWNGDASKAAGAAPAEAAHASNPTARK